MPAGHIGPYGADLSGAFQPQNITGTWRWRIQAGPLHQISAVYCTGLDANGNLIQTTDALGGVTARTYNGQGQLLSLTDANGNSTAYAYDAEGNLASMTDALGRTTRFTHDGRGLLTAVTRPDGTVERRTHERVQSLCGAVGL